MQGKKEKLVAENTALRSQIETLKNQRVPLVAQRDDLQQNIIPAIREQITQLTEQKQQQEAEKNEQIAEKNEIEAESNRLASEIASQEKEIATVQVSIARSQDLYARNSAEEAQERKQNPIEDFLNVAGVWA